MKVSRERCGEAIEIVTTVSWVPFIMYVSSLMKTLKLFGVEDEYMLKIFQCTTLHQAGKAKKISK